ncbi:MAG: agmatinase family protein [Polyangiaceae bacterium]
MSFDPNAAAPADSGVFGLDHSPEAAKVVLVPVPWDATTSYRAGTANGPLAILEASRQVDLYDVETGTPYKAKIAMVWDNTEVESWNVEARACAVPVIEAGGNVAGNPDLIAKLARTNALGELLNGWVYEKTKALLAAGKIVGIVGGDHSVPFGAIRAISELHPGVGILHVDAHADLRHAYEGFEWSHASIMENVARRLPNVAKIVAVGIRDFCEEELVRTRESKGRIETHYDVTLATARMTGTLLEAFAAIVSALPEKVYVSFDIDGLDPVLCPHTGTPVPGGLSFHEASALLRELVKAGKTIVGFDLNEVAPGPEGDEWDGNVGARVLYKLIGWTLLSQGIGAP